MGTPDIIPVIPCGGSGTRLWPLSRQSYPKQFAPLLGQGSLFQACARRFLGEGFAAPWVITASDFRFIVAEQLQEAGVVAERILLEPEGRGTAHAILAVALALRDRPDALLLVAPSDHVIPDKAAFCEAVRAGIPAATSGQMVTFGITPSRAETGYGWVELAGVPGPEGPIGIKRFIEKPGKAAAQEMFEGETFLWNAGIFLFSVKTVLGAFDAHAPKPVESVRKAVDEAQPDLGFLRLASAPWKGLDEISIDYAIMERAQNLVAVPYAGFWSDLGSWDAVWHASKRDGANVACAESTTAIDCENTLLRSEPDGLEVVGVGLKNIIAVAIGDAVLVANMDRVQDVGQAVLALQDKAAPQATQFPREYRPWGWFESLTKADRFQVKRIVVKPGGILSLQSHVHRAEHWIVVEGTAKVTIAGVEKLVSENESVFIPLGAKHRLENPGKLPMVLIEVQTGAYLGEDDIERFEDLYARA